MRIRRVYSSPEPGDGVRVLVDRLWPRGVAKADERVATWMPDVAPSHELRRWFDHDPDRWEEFRRRYHEELDASREAVRRLLELAGREPVTLVYAAREDRYNNAEALREYLIELAASGTAGGRGDTPQSDEDAG